LVGPHEGSVTRAKQELGVDERTEQRVTCGPIKTPQSLRLRRRQSKSWHFDVLTLNSPEDVVKRLLLCCHWCSPCSVPEVSGDRALLSNACATTHVDRQHDSSSCNRQIFKNLPLSSSW
jgi:hypothetical protein